MDVPSTWAWTLIAAGVTAVLAVIGLRWRGSPRSKFIPPVTHLLAGGLTGFMFLAFYPAAPLVIAIGGMLATRASQASRWTEATLLAIGFGAAWTWIIGLGMLNDALDPAVSGQDATLPFLVGAVVLISGLLVLIGLTFMPKRFNPR